MRHCDGVMRRLKDVSLALTLHVSGTSQCDVTETEHITYLLCKYDVTFFIGLLLVG